MTEVWINAGAQLITTILASTVSVWLAIHIYKKEQSQAKEERDEIRKINTSNAISFINFACSCLAWVHICDQGAHESKMELEKITIVNETLKEIRSSDVSKEFVNDYQNSKIILQILEVEIKTLIRDKSSGTIKSDEFSKIDIERRMEMLENVVKKYDSYSSV